MSSIPCMKVSFTSIHTVHIRFIRTQHASMGNMQALCKCTSDPAHIQILLYSGLLWTHSMLVLAQCSAIQLQNTNYAKQTQHIDSPAAELVNPWKHWNSVAIHVYCFGLTIMRSESMIVLSRCAMVTTVQSTKHVRSVRWIIASVLCKDDRDRYHNRIDFTSSKCTVLVLSLHLGQVLQVQLLVGEGATTRADVCDFNNSQSVQKIVWSCLQN